jgi:hypothetical protein
MFARRFSFTQTGAPHVFRRSRELRRVVNRRAQCGHGSTMIAT